MQVLTVARRAPGLVAALVMLAWPAAPAAASTASRPAAQATHRHPTTTSLVRMSGWSAGPVHRLTGYERTEGSSRVREIQRRLGRLGYGPGPVDGRFGPRTERATRRFQLRRGLRTDGVVGAQTLTALRADSADRRAAADWSAGPVGRWTGYHRRDGSRRVREVQWDLRRLRYAPGPVDGRFGPRTETAARRYQVRHGLPADGVVGRRMLLALRSRVPHTSISRPAAARPPSVPAALATVPRPRPGPPPGAAPPPGLPIRLVTATLLALGALTVALTYVRTRGRVRAARRAAARPSEGSPHDLPA